MDSIVSPKVITMEGKKVGAHSLVHNTLGVKGHVRTSKWNLWGLTNKSIIRLDLHKPNIKLVNAYLDIFGAWMNHKQTRTHKTHHGSDLGEAITFPLLILFMFGHGANTQMSFCFRTPKSGFPKLRLLRLWRPITLCADLWLKWGFKQSCSPCQELSNGKCHATCT